MTHNSFATIFQMIVCFTTVFSICEICSWWCSEAVNYAYSTALLWQKEASDKSDISCKSKMCLSFLLMSMAYHDVLPNISLIAGWVLMHKIWPGRRAHYRIRKHQINQIYMVCHLLPLAKVVQNNAAVTQSHHVEAMQTIEAMQGNVHKMGWNEAISWQLWDPCGCYRVYMAVYLQVSTVYDPEIAM